MYTESAWSPLSIPVQLLIEGGAVAMKLGSGGYEIIIYEMVII